MSTAEELQSQHHLLSTALLVRGLRNKRACQTLNATQLECPN